MRKKNQPLIFILISFGLLLSSCRTVSQHINQDPRLVEIAKKLNSSCFETKNPNFSAQLNSTKFLPTVTVEGVWKENLNVFYLEFSDPIGENQGGFRLKDHMLETHFKETDKIHFNENDPLLSFLSSIGSHGMRKMLCGCYAMNKDRFDEQTVLQINRHDIKIKNTFSISNQDHNTILTIDSRYFYGFFSSDADIQTTWTGLVEKNGVRTKSIRFTFENSDSYFIDFMDYE